MKIENKQIKISTENRFEVIDITKDVKGFISECGAKNGQVLVYSQHTTLAIVVNEKESGISKDADEFLAKLLPKDQYYCHNDMEIRTENLVCDTNSECLNGDSHVKHLLLGTSETIPVFDGKMQFGPWQRIMAIELDGPRKDRGIIFQFLGESINE